MTGPRMRHASLDTPIARSLYPPGLNGRALSSAGERSLHTGEVIGSIPIAPTIQGRHRSLSAIQRFESALPPKAHIRQLRRHVPFVPIAGIDGGLASAWWANNAVHKFSTAKNA
jgi:hypothetical protein